jgi:hypothetical protein
MEAVLMRERYVEYDEAPSAVTDHAFEPRGAWYTKCKHCDLAEAAHATTTITSLDAIRADHARQNGREEPVEEPVMSWGYYSDDNEDDDE